MRFQVRHETTYRYTAPVRLASHVLRMRPRDDAGELYSFGLTIDPTPTLERQEVDIFGNSVTRLEFAGLTTMLRIESRFELETGLTSLDAAQVAAPTLPWSGAVTGAMSAYLGGGDPAPTVRSFAESLAAACGGQASAFFDHMNQTLYRRVRRHIRHAGEAQSAAETLSIGSGACRDLTVLFMEAARALGVPARFVSGYQAHSENHDGRRHLHAWPEVYLPGVGWRGYDPTHGAPVLQDHVALAAAPDQAATMPLEGSFFAGGVGSTLEYRLDIVTGD